MAMPYQTAYLARDFARFYDWSVPDPDDLEFYLDLAAKHGSPVLELACGTGRLTIPLARGGHDVVGIDVSEEMLGIAREKLSEEPSEVRRRVKLLQGDMSRFHLGTTFGLIMIPFSSFFHLHTADNHRACLSAVHEHLAPDGAAAIDLWPAVGMANQEVGVTRLVAESVNPATGKMTRELNKKLEIDHRLQRVTAEHTYIEEEPDGRETRYAFVERYTWLTEDEMTNLLWEAGFAEISVLGGYDGRPFDAAAEHMIFVASR